MKTTAVNQLVLNEGLSSIGYKMKVATDAELIA